ncbi:MAG: tetratricopeptide repeat protein [Phycisphaeraceae bacterium]|nr:tetratricopeptide repeat protein [Phycisphaeraceae bacterium]
MKKLFPILGVLLLVLSACASQEAMKSPPQAATQSAEEPAIVPLTKEEALKLADEARQTHLSRRIAVMTAFREAAEKAMPTMPASDRSATEALIQRIGREIQMIRDGQYVSVSAGEEPAFDLAPLAEAKATCEQQLVEADETYLGTMRQTLHRDPEGHIGQRLTEQLSTTVDILLICALMDFYWHHGNLDNPPGSFDHCIRLGYRYLELEPKEPGAGTMYSDTAWLLWSRWVNWKNDPKQMPVGEGDDEVALRLLERGSAVNPDNAPYHYDAAMSLWGLAQFHNPKYYDFITRSLKVAAANAKDDKLKARVFMQLGHAYRKQGQMAEAKTWYEKVLSVEPENEIARRIIAEELGDPATQPGKSD